MMIIPTSEQPRKRVRMQPEARIQADCVRWLWNEHPETRGLYIHIPNEGNRNSEIDGVLRRALGLVAGAPDTFLFIARGGFHGLAIEFKTANGVQSEVQKTFQLRLENNGYKYIIVRSLDEFKKVIKEYLAL